MNSVVTWKPLRTGIRPVWDNFFDDFFGSDFYDSFRKPAADIVESESAYSFEIELPGFREKEIDVKLESDVLTVKAEKISKEQEKDKGRRIVSERCEKFFRSFVLPENADSEKITARFEDGLLSLEILKKEKEKPRKIEIKK